MLDFVIRHSDTLDVIAAISCFIGSLACVYLMQVILKERSAAIQWQRVALGLLSLALFSNAATAWPDWLPGRRPTGFLVDICVTVLLLVMAVRGRMMRPERYDDGKPEAEGAKPTEQSRDFGGNHAMGSV